MTAPNVALAVTDPAAFVLAVTDLREQRAKAAITEGSAPPWRVTEAAGCGCCANIRGGGGTLLASADDRYAEHIAAEASPAHALAEVALWRGVVGRHRLGWHDPLVNLTGPTVTLQQAKCVSRCGDWPCMDLRAVVAAARAYLTGGPS